MLILYFGKYHSGKIAAKITCLCASHKPYILTIKENNPILFPRPNDYYWEHTEETVKNKIRYSKIRSDIIICSLLRAMPVSLRCFFVLFEILLLEYWVRFKMSTSCKIYPFQSTWTLCLIWFDVFFSSLIAWRTGKESMLFQGFPP